MRYLAREAWGRIGSRLEVGGVAIAAGSYGLWGIVPFAVKIVSTYSESAKIVAGLGPTSGNVSIDQQQNQEYKVNEAF